MQLVKLANAGAGHSPGDQIAILVKWQIPKNGLTPTSTTRQTLPFGSPDYLATSHMGSHRPWANFLCFPQRGTMLDAGTLLDAGSRSFPLPPSRKANNPPPAPPLRTHLWFTLGTESRNSFSPKHFLPLPTNSPTPSRLPHLISIKPRKLFLPHPTISQPGIASLLHSTQSNHCRY